MTAGLNPDKLKQLSNSALVQAGLPIVLALQQQIEQQLADTLLKTTSADVPTSETTADFTPAQLDQLKKSIGQELEKAFASASLAAIAELALLGAAAQSATGQSHPGLSPELLSGLSETPPTEGSSEGEQITTPASTAAPASQTEPSAPASESPALGPGGMPTTQTGRTTQQLLQPTTAPTTGAAAPKPARGATMVPGSEETAPSSAPEEPAQDQTVDQYKEQAIAHALAAERNRRTAYGQPDASGQQQAAYGHGLNLVANEGAKLGGQLKQNIKTGKFSSFFLCLILALIKDIVEPIAVFYFDPGITGWVLSVFIGALLTALLFGEGTWFRRWLIKKFIGKAMVAVIVGLIPGVNIVFPEYTVGVLLMGYDNFKALQGLKNTLAELEHNMGKFKKLAASGPRGLAKARQLLNPLREASDV